jgi:hypothetical protein
MTVPFNKADAPNAARALGLDSRRHRRGVGERERSAVSCAMQYVASIVLLVIAVGCASRPATQIVNGPTRIDPRLLEQTDERAPHFAEERAKAYHQTTTYAERYSIFQRSRVLAHGGYSAKFGSRSNSSEGVTYFFDERNQMMTMERRFPPY